MNLFEVFYYGHLFHHEGGELVDRDRSVFVIAEDLETAMKIVIANCDKAPIFQCVCRLAQEGTDLFMEDTVESE